MQWQYGRRVIRILPTWSISVKAGATTMTARIRSNKNGSCQRGCAERMIIHI